MEEKKITISKDDYYDLTKRQLNYVLHKFKKEGFKIEKLKDCLKSYYISWE